MTSTTVRFKPTDIYKRSNVQGTAKIIAENYKVVNNDGKTMFDKMGEFRGAWGTTIEKICSDASFADEYIAVRTKTMVLGKQAMAIEGRLKEYAERAAILLAQAEKAHAAAMKMGEIEDKSTRKIGDAAKVLIGKMESIEKEAASFKKKAATLLKSVSRLKTKKGYSKKDHATAETVLADIETTRKDIKGKNKTAELLARQFDDLLKGQKPFFFKVQLQAREDLMGKIASAVSDVEDAQADAKSIYKDLGKKIAA